MIASCRGFSETAWNGITPSCPAWTRAKSKELTEKEMKDFQSNNLQVALEQCRWKIFGDEGSAALLGILATTLISRIKKWNLKKP